MPDWDEDSPQLRQNLTHLLEAMADAAERRETPAAEMARGWQRSFMRGLKPSNPRYLGAFRGESDLEKTGVKVGANYGTPPARVAAELKRFEETLQKIVAQLDQAIPFGEELDADQIAAVIDVCAWAHAEWVRIHPFANRNGRTARLWADFLAMRYGLPPFIRLRPRPDAGYADAGAKAMQGDWEATAVVFRRLLNRFSTEFC